MQRCRNRGHSLEPERSQPHRPGRKTAGHPNYENDAGRADSVLSVSENSDTDNDEDFEPTGFRGDAGGRRAKS